MPRMRFVIVQNKEPGVTVPIKKADTGEISWTILLDAKLLPHINSGPLVKAAQNYCEKLNDIIGKDESGKENNWQVCAHFKWNPKKSKQMAVRFHGQLLEELRGLCGERIKFRFEGTLARYENGVAIPFKTKPMRIFSYCTIAQVSDESSCWEFNQANQAYCEDLDVKVPTRIISHDEIRKTDFVAVTATGIRFQVKDDYIYLPDEGGSLIERRCQLNVLKTIMRQEASSDISIHGVDGFKVTAHRCFLMAHSPVLKKMVEQCTFGRMKWTDVSVNCIKSLLEYVYTFHISHAVKSSKLAVELFLTATKYEMSLLQQKLGKMILERRIGWFHITPTLDLFLCIRKLGRTSSIDDLMCKIGQVLKWNGKALIMQSEGYQRLVVDDVNAAKELCTAMANAD